MPRWASRLTLIVEEVRRQRIYDMTDYDVMEEGISAITKDGGQTVKFGIPDRDGLPGNDSFGWAWNQWMLTSLSAYSVLWNALHKKPRTRWEDNPEVVALRFWVVNANIDAMEGK